MMLNKRAILITGGSLLLILAATGCATRKWVRNRVDPLDTRVTKTEAQTGALDKKIDTVDENAQKASSHAEEVARGADANAKAAGDAAGRAQGTADEATKQASNAHDLAQQGMTRISGMETTIDNLDRYQLVTQESIQFPFGSANLTKEAKEQADQFIQKVGSMKRYAVEVEGFTDSTGTADYNRQLGAKRADAVVRYLTINGKLPLYRVHALGVGDEAPVDSNKTREGRKQNRRVELRIYAPPDTANEQAKTGPQGQ